MARIAIDISACGLDPALSDWELPAEVQTLRALLEMVGRLGHIDPSLSTEVRRVVKELLGVAIELGIGHE